MAMKLRGNNKFSFRSRNGLKKDRRKAACCIDGGEVTVTGLINVY